MKTTKILQQSAEIGTGMFLFLLIHSFTINMLYITVHWTNAGQWRPTKTNKDQQRPTKANTGQQGLMKAHSCQWPMQANEDHKIPQQSAEIGPGMFSFLFIHSFTINMLYVYWTNTGQWRPMKANEGQQRPTKTNKDQCRPTKTNKSSQLPVQGDGQCRPSLPTSPVAGVQVCVR